MEINRQANFSNDGTHRFWLLRSWADQPRMITIVGLNPSTANAEQDDATIRSCIRLATAAGFGGFIMCNLFSFITSKPAVLYQNIQRSNWPASDVHLKNMIAKTHHTVCAWGSWNNIYVQNRAAAVIKMIDSPLCFGINADGSPKHPLYLKSNTPLTPFKK